MEHSNNIYNYKVNEFISEGGRITFLKNKDKLFICSSQPLNNNFEPPLILSTCIFMIGAIIMSIWGLELHNAFLLGGSVLTAILWAINAILFSKLVSDDKSIEYKLKNLQNLDFNMSMLNKNNQHRLLTMLNLFNNFEKNGELTSLLSLINNRDYKKINLILDGVDLSILRRELIEESNVGAVIKTIESRELLNSNAIKSEKNNEKFLNEIIEINPSLHIMKHLDKNVELMNPIDKSKYQKIYSTLLEANTIIKNSDYLINPEAKSKDLNKFNKIVEVALPTLNDIVENLHNSNSDKLEIAAIFLSDALSTPLEIEGNLHKVDEVASLVKNEDKTSSEVEEPINIEK